MAVLNYTLSRLSCALKATTTAVEGKGEGSERERGAATFGPEVKLKLVWTLKRKFSCLFNVLRNSFESKKERETVRERGSGRERERNINTEREAKHCKLLHTNRKL